MDMQKASSLASKICDDILSASAERATRIQLMIGHWPNDRPDGGLCESALTTLIAESIYKHTK